MKKSIIIFVGVLVLIGIVSVAIIIFHQTPITNYPPKNTTVVAFGDSLVEGVGATEGNDFISVLARKIGRPIINLGVRGDTSADGLLRIDEVLDEDPGIVVLLLGGNDALRRIPEETTKKNLESIIETLQKNGSLVILLGVRGNILGSSRDDMYEELSEKYDMPYVEDVLDGILLHTELMHDGIHPNDAGYAIIADRLYEVFTTNDV